MRHIGPVVIIVLSMIALAVIIGIARNDNSSKYNYTVKFSRGNWSSEEYTNSFEYIPGNATVKYVNEFGDSVIRSGTFSIERNRHFQK